MGLDLRDTGLDSVRGYKMSLQLVLMWADLRLLALLNSSDLSRLDLTLQVILLLLMLLLQLELELLQIELLLLLMV